MSADADTRAEVARLARVLGLEGPEPLSYLSGVPARELRDYREAVTSLLFERDAQTLGRAANASRLLPSRTLAGIGERALGPLICARLTGLLEPHRAVDIARHMSIAFLAQLAAELDPLRIVDLLAGISPQRLLDIAVAMAANREHVAMGRFVAHLDEATLAACVQQLGDEDVLRVSFTLQGKDKLTRIVELAGLDRTRRMLAAANALGLREEADDLLDHLSARQREQLGRVAQS